MKPRAYREEDRPVVARLCAASLGGSVERWEKKYDPEENPRFDPGAVRVVEEDGEVRATAAALPLEVYVDGRPAAIDGVADVATHAAYRRRGHAGELMRVLLSDVRERGVHLSMLWPFAHAFYRRFGWELASESIGYALKPTDLPTGDEQRHVRAYREDDLPRMMELLEAEAAGHQCCVRRREEHWRKLLSGDGLNAAVYEESGRVEGYALYCLSGWREGRDPARELSLPELAVRTPEAHAGLLSFAGAFDPLVFEVRLSTPRGEPLHPYLPSSYVEAKVSSEFMLRLVDVEGALGLLDRETGEPLVLDVSDDVIPKNAGTYTVGGGEVVRGAEAEERVSLDVRQLAQLYAGYLPVRQLARHGLVEAGSRRALELLEAYFPPDDPYIYPLDHF